MMGTWLEHDGNFMDDGNLMETGWSITILNNLFIVDDIGIESILCSWGRVGELSMLSRIRPSSECKRCWCSAWRSSPGNRLFLRVIGVEKKQGKTTQGKTYCGKNSVINHPRLGNGKHTTYKNGDDWGMVRLWHCFSHIDPCFQWFPMYSWFADDDHRFISLASEWLGEWQTDWLIGSIFLAKLMWWVHPSGLIIYTEFTNRKCLKMLILRSLIGKEQHNPWKGK